MDLRPTTEQCDRYTLADDDGEPVATLVDAPGLEQASDAEWWGRKAADIDGLIWVVGAHRADRRLDLAALTALRDWYRAHPERSPPPIILAVSHVDRLSPAREWAPPYNLTEPDRPKARTIAEAVEQIGTELDMGDGDCVPVRLDQGAEGYNVDLLWALLEDRLHQAKRGRAQRLQRLARGRDWTAVLRQARSTGRWLKGALKKSFD